VDCTSRISVNKCLIRLGPNNFFKKDIFTEEQSFPCLARSVSTNVLTSSLLKVSKRGNPFGEGRTLQEIIDAMGRDSK